MPHRQSDSPSDSPPSGEHPDARDLVAAAGQRLLQSVDGLPDDAWADDTDLPGWTRAHVVAHLTLNAEGLARALDGVRKGRPVPVYDSQDDRDADIARLAEQAPSVIRERLFAATARLRDELAAMTADLEAARVERHPGGPSFSALEAVPMRWREVEIHHVDLGVGYLPTDWEPAFVAHLLGTAAADRDGEVDVVLRSPEGDVVVGDGSGPVVTGTAADLAWWLVRGGGAGLSGPVPTLGPWQRRPVPTPPAPPTTGE